MPELTSQVDRFRSAEGQNLVGVVSAAPGLTLFYDGQCPLCLREMQQLQHHDRKGLIYLVDIHSDEMHMKFPMIDKNQASNMLHAMRSDGSMLYGLDVTCTAWNLVGKHKWLKILRLPVLRVIADAFYLLFARHRYTISGLLTGKQRCESCTLRG